MKKKCIFPLALAAIMLLPLLASAAGFLNRISYTVNYDYSNLTVGTDTLGGVTYATVGYEGLYNGGAPGTPSLPIDYIRFSVPYNATNFTVTATRIRPSNRNLDYLVYPCQMPRLTDGSQAPPVTLPDTAAYFSGNPYPTQVAWIADEGFLAGENHIVTVAVMPLRYTHSTSADVLSLPLACNLVLRYDLSDSLAMYPIVRNDSLLREEGYQLTQTMVVNPGEVKGFAPAYTFSPGIDTTGFIQGGIGGYEINGGGISGPDPIDPGILGEEELLVDGGNYTYLIVTTSELKHAVRRIAALKRQKGYNVKIVTMNDVLSSPLSGRGDVIGQGDNAHLTYTDNAGKLRQYIRNHFYYYGTQYVLLTGDIPYRYANMKKPLNLNDTISLPSDMYFADLNGNWRSNVFDYQAELYVGRIIAKNENQIDNYTDKLFRYTLNPGNSDCSYLKRAFYSVGYDFSNSGEINTVRSQLDYIYTYNKVLSESRNINDKSKFPSGENIIDTINAGNYGFMSLHHHGFPAGLLTYGLRNGSKLDYYRFLWAVDNVHTFVEDAISANDDPSTTNALNHLNNKSFPSLCYSSACSTMPFDVMPGYEDIPMNFGESFTTGKDYGGPAFIGNTRTGYTPNTGSLERAFAKKLNEGYYQIGVANALAKSTTTAFLNDTIRDRYTAINQNLLGDPEFEVWTNEPEQYENIVVQRTNQSLSIYGLNAGSTIVAYYNTQKIPTRKIAMTDVITLNDASSTSPIMLYEHNYLPLITPLIIQNERINNSQYIIVSDMMAGQNIVSNRTNGDVIIESGIEYEVETSGTITLEDGFKVERGATFAIYPSCF